MTFIHEIRGRGEDLRPLRIFSSLYMSPHIQILCCSGPSSAASRSSHDLTACMRTCTRTCTQCKEMSDLIDELTVPGEFQAAFNLINDGQQLPVAGLQQ